MDLFVALSSHPPESEAWQYLGVLESQMVPLRLPQTIHTPFSILKNMSGPEKTLA